ncbi:hypothetical protein C8R43DRAFT_852284, partial [Mycena crocata]
RSFASVHVSAFIHPALMLEHSAYVVSARCDPTTSTITIGFKHRTAWSAALAAWKQHPKFLILAFVDTCGLGRESGERSVHVVHNITTIFNKLEIVCAMSELTLADAIHPDLPVALHVGTIEVHDPNPP